MMDFYEIKKLYKINDPCGFNRAELSFLKSKHGHFPQVFIDYYIELGRHKFNEAYIRLLIPEELQNPMFNHEGSEYFVFYLESQGVYEWGINKNHMHLPNPSVYITYGGQWKLDCNNLENFFTAMAYYQAIHLLEFYPEDFIFELNDNDLDFIRKNFKNKGVSLLEYVCGIDFYGNHDDCIIVISAEQDMSYASSNKEHFAEMDKILSKVGVAY